MSLLVRGGAASAASATAPAPASTSPVAARVGALRTAHTAAANSVQATA
ncbi:hypothetical protein ACFQ0G_42275 [Streptomyces chiangmaiensis]